MNPFLFQQKHRLIEHTRGYETVGSCSRSVLPWDALPATGTLFLPALSRPFSLVPTTSSASPPSRTAALICAAPTAACPLVSEMQPVNRAQRSVALSCPCPPHPPFDPSRTCFSAMSPRREMCGPLVFAILLFPLIPHAPPLALQLVLCPPLLSLLVSPGSREQRTRTGRTLHAHLDLHASEHPTPLRLIRF